MAARQRTRKGVGGWACTRVGVGVGGCLGVGAGFPGGCLRCGRGVESGHAAAAGGCEGWRAGRRAVGQQSRPPAVRGWEHPPGHSSPQTSHPGGRPARGCAQVATHPPPAPRGKSSPTACTAHEHVMLVASHSLLLSLLMPPWQRQHHGSLHRVHPAACQHEAGGGGAAAHRGGKRGARQAPAAGT